MVLHLIMNSHLDPVWLWDKRQGIDEVLATARTACELLNDYPQLHLTRGEAWFYEIVEAFDKKTFKRISEFIAEGRWHVVGGWYVQPDCNLASPETYRMHGKIGCGYFHEKFGVKIKTGYNVDSFGHTAYLPSFYADAGIKNYVFMRPMEHEKHLPYHTFYWEAPNGKRVLASRILSSYATWDNVESQIQEVVAEASSQYNDAMCFVGFGDHGGGPVRKEIDWLLEHWDKIPGVDLKFSHPDAYFDAIRKSKVEIPVYRGELQHHAIGCYSACSRIKREVRKTENTLLQLGRYMTDKQNCDAWKKLLFSTFHDALAGTCIKSAYDELYDELGAVRSAALDAFTANTRRMMTKLPPAPRQRLLLFNTGAERLVDTIPMEPPLCPPFLRATNCVTFYREDGTPVPSQEIPTENSVTWIKTFLLPVDIPPRSMAIYELDYNPRESRLDAPVKTDGKGTVKAGKATFSLGSKGINNIAYGNSKFFAKAPCVQVYDDKSDTWSHNMKGYFDEPIDSFQYAEKKWTLLNFGSLFVEYGRHSTDSNGNRLDWRCGAFAKIPGMLLRLRLGWLSKQKLVKLCFYPSFQVTHRIDGVSGGSIERKCDGEEYPVFNRLSIYGQKPEQSLTFVSSQIFSASVSADGMVGLTLIRSPFYAHHLPVQPNDFSYAGIIESGELDFDIAILPNATEEEVDAAVYRSTKPFRFCSITNGIKL